MAKHTLHNIPRINAEPRVVGKKFRVGFVNTHPIQYFAPLYAFLNRCEDLSITAFYLSDFSLRGDSDRNFAHAVKWDVDLLQGYNVNFIRGFERRPEPSGFFSTLALGLWNKIRDEQLDALIVHGHSPAAMLVAIAAGRAAGVKVFMRSETHLGLTRSPVKKTLRKLIMGALYSQLDGVLAIGSANAAFYRAMGIKEGKIFLMPYAVDNVRFTKDSKILDTERARIRAGFGVFDQRPILLYAAKFQRRKQPGDLLRAAALLNEENIPFHLVMVGSGEQEDELHAIADRLQIKNICFVGFVNQRALPGVYGSSDVFVLPSVDEPWGLAVNEAMCAGLPIVASADIGCVADLVQDGSNGMTFHGGDIESLTNALRALLTDNGRREQMGALSKDVISRWSYAECLAGLRLALTTTCGAGERS